MPPQTDDAKSSRLIPNNRFTRFVIVGLSNAVVGYTVFVLMFYSEMFPVSIRTPISQTISYAVGIGWAFLWNRHWAFKQQASESSSLRTESFRFFALQVACLIISAILVTFFVDRLEILPSIGWVLAMTVVTVINFLAMHFWVFPKAGGADQET